MPSVVNQHNTCPLLPRSPARAEVRLHQRGEAPRVGAFATAYARAVLRNSGVLEPDSPLPARGLVVLPARSLMKQLPAGHQISGQQLATPAAEHWVCGGGGVTNGRPCGCGQPFKEVSTSAGRHTPGVAQIPHSAHSNPFLQNSTFHWCRATLCTWRSTGAPPTIILSTSRRRWKPPLSAAWESSNGVPYWSVCHRLPTIKKFLTSRMCWAGAY